MLAFLAGLFFYLLGTIPFSYLIVRWRQGGDIRRLGSGNSGASNVVRQSGLIYGIAAFALDFLKGALSAYLARRWGLPLWLAGLAVVGHDWSPWLRFRGGKGVATSLGLILVLSWPTLLITVGIWLLTVMLSGWASLASLLALGLSPLALLLRESSLSNLLFLVGLALLAAGRHHKNIARLIRGKERSLFKKT
ncbi:MAG TPA: glycerol-3-phosphate 1-O-acyltransferase [Candidatus Fraserbacteria bacterium]|nr:glycerol-3-phosphate 1-O-acyltransferase [Candidatus Fraserbacteria bacterium]